LGLPGALTAGAKDHDRTRILFDPNFRDASFTGVSTAICDRGESVLPPLPQIDFPARRGEVPVLEVPSGIRTRLVIPEIRDGGEDRRKQA
jgi:hypothetical protein